MKDHDELKTLPVMEEVVIVEKQVEDGRRVRVRTVVEDRNELITETVRQGVIEVERVTVGEFVDEAPLAREEGNTLIVPVIEERLVVERRLFLIEEVRLHRSSREVAIEIPETRRVMRAVVEEINTDQQLG